MTKIIQFLVDDVVFKWIKDRAKREPHELAKSIFLNGFAVAQNEESDLAAMEKYIKENSQQ